MSRPVRHAICAAVAGLAVTTAPAPAAETRTMQRCASAKEYEAIDQSGGPLRFPRKAAGFRFTLLRAKAAQELRMRGRRGATTIRFDYRLPSG